MILIDTILRLLLLLLGLAAHFAVSGLDSILLHCQGAIHIVQFVVQPAGIAHRVSIGISSPQRGGARVTVAALGSSSLANNQAFLGSNQWAVLSIHFVIKPAGIAQIMATNIPSP